MQIGKNFTKYGYLKCVELTKTQIEEWKKEVLLSVYFFLYSAEHAWAFVLWVSCDYYQSSTVLWEHSEEVDYSKNVYSISFPCLDGPLNKWIRRYWHYNKCDSL